MNFANTMSRRQALKLAGGVAALTTISSVGMKAFAQEAAAGVKITHVRNATLLIDYAGTRFLFDPMLADQGTFPPFPGTPNPVDNPTVPLPLDIDTLTNVDAVIVTHMHEDHWDQVARDALSKSLPIFVQDEADAAMVRASGFEDVRVLTLDTQFNGITLARTGGLHGSQEVVQILGDDFGRVCGVAFKHADHKTVYVAGDTVWNDQVAEAIEVHAPDVIVLNSGQAYLFGVGSILMGAEDVLTVHQAAPNATIVGVHMEAVNHCVLTRAYLQAFADQNDFLPSLLVPADGETMTF